MPTFPDRSPRRLSDLCEQQADCSCSRKFRNDDQHQYLLSHSYRLFPKQRLDLVALMQTDLQHSDHLHSPHALVFSPVYHEKMRTSSSNSSIGTNGTTRTHSNSDEVDCTIKLTCAIDGLRRKKSASLNSPANSGKRSPNEFLSITCGLFRKPSNCGGTRTERIALVMAQLFGKD